MQTRRVSSLLGIAVTTLVSAAVLSGCVYSAEPAAGSPSDPNVFSTSGFPAPGPTPVPGQITPGQVATPAPANSPRPATGPQGTQPTPSPATSAGAPSSTNAPAPAPGS